MSSATIPSVFSCHKTQLLNAEYSIIYSTIKNSPMIRREIYDLSKHEMTHDDEIHNENVTEEIQHYLSCGFIARDIS